MKFFKTQAQKWRIVELIELVVVSLGGNQAPGGLDPWETRPLGGTTDPLGDRQRPRSRWYSDEHGVDVGGVTVVDILAGKAHGLGPVVISGHSPENLRLGSGL